MRVEMSSFRYHQHCRTSYVVGEASESQSEITTATTEWCEVQVCVWYQSEIQIIETEVETR